MNICQAYCSHDRSQSIRWQEQVKKWGGLGNHKLFLLPAFDCPPIPEILPFTALTDYAKVTSDWSAGAGNQTNCASGPDSMWRMFARYFYTNELGPWYNCEPDCVPLFPDSFDRWEAEYLRAGKDFMGAYVDFPVPHLTGCAFYPGNAATYIDLILPHRTHDKKREISFDVAGGNVTLPNAYLTKSIQHVWRAPSFTSQADFDARVSKDALFYHACKDGTIYQFLKGGDAPCPISHPMKPEEQGSSGTEKVQAPPVPDLPVPVNWRPPKELQAKGFFREQLEPHIPLTEQSAILTSDGGIRSPTAEEIAQDSNSIEIQRARAAKARAKLAAMRAAGWKPKRRRRKSRKAK